MRLIPCILFLLLPLLAQAQSDMRVYTVAGSNTPAILGDGGPATAGGLSSTEGIWVDSTGNIYISDLGHARIRKVTAATNIITTIAGTGSPGFSGDGGPATSANIKQPYGLYSDAIGNVYFADKSNSRVRRIDKVTGLISTIAGGGIVIGDNGPATDAQLNTPQSVYLDVAGNIYIGEVGRIRKVNPTTGIITTVAGDGTVGFWGDGGQASIAQISSGPSGMVCDAVGNLYFADRGNHRVRKINKISGVITTVAGTTGGYSGDGSSATNAQIAGPIGLAIDHHGNLIIADNGNDVIRQVDIVTGIIATIAGEGIGAGSDAEGVPATSAYIHPEFLYIDASGNIYYSNWGTQVRKITNYYKWLKTESPFSSIPDVEIFPNPAADELTINTDVTGYTSCAITNSMGRVLLLQQLSTAQTTIDISRLPAGLYYITARGSSGVKTLRFVKM